MNVARQHERDDRDGSAEDDDSFATVLRVVTLVARAVAVGLAVVASVELLQPSGLRPVALAGVLCVALVGVPVIGFVAALRQWSRSRAPVSLAVWLAAGAAVLIATSLRPLSHVHGMQTGGLIAVAIPMFVLPIVKGGYSPRGAILLTDRFGSGPAGGSRPWS